MHVLWSLSSSWGRSQQVEPDFSTSASGILQSTTWSQEQRSQEVFRKRQENNFFSFQCLFAMVPGKSSLLKTGLRFTTVLSCHPELESLSFLNGNLNMKSGKYYDIRLGIADRENVKTSFLSLKKSCFYSTWENKSRKGNVSLPPVVWNCPKYSQLFCHPEEVGR